MDTPFNPAKAATANVDVSSSSQRVQFASGTGAKQVRMMNNGSATVWVELGDVTVTAVATTGFPVGPGVTEVLTTNETYAAVIAAGSTGKIYFTPGTGI